ncbi:hypothetical protein Clacol_004837 [Clathrus columnatus]|uniref:Uncharacterized protein n=1 Tax=Clathrus columnatus TaxID=1419009 RepID=A0AAV5ACG6_9AGAM|nr:hypothetical protein Clacol_004837 [Clathrus columnatus]
MQNPSWSTDKPLPYQPQTSSQANTQELPPSYAPPSYPPHNYPSSESPYAAPAAYGNPGPSSDGQYQWQPPPPSPSYSRPVPSIPGTREVFAPPPSHPSSSVTRPWSAPVLGSDHNLKRDPLNPPPPSFSRLAPPRPPLPPFPPLILRSKDTSLDKGFPLILPMPSYPGPQAANPYQQQGLIHPFSQRDVLEADWTRLLEDIYITAQLSGTQRIAANVIPLAAGVSFIGGIFLTKGIEKRMKKKNSEPAADLVDVWNQHFFHSRGLHVILAHGPESLSGEYDGPAPDWAGGRGSGADFGSDSSSDDDSRRRRKSGGLAGGLQGRLEARLSGRSGGGRRDRDARGGREERKDRRAARKAEKFEHYRLVVVPI